MRPYLARPAALGLTLILATGTLPAQEAAPAEQPAPTAESGEAKSPPVSKDSETKPEGTAPSSPAGSGAADSSATPPRPAGAVTPPSIPAPPPPPGTTPPVLPGSAPPGFPGVPTAPPASGAATALSTTQSSGHPALFRYYDKNGDQVLSSEELAKVPAPIREWIAKEKLDVTEGLKREVFDASAPKLVDHLRARTAETILAPAPLPVPGSQPAPSNGGGRNDRSRGGSSEFRGLDLDQDAQLSFREWRAGKRLAADFAPRDLNGDGMVTSAEFDQTKDLASSGTVAPGVGTAGTVTNGAVSSRPMVPGGTTPPRLPGPAGSPPVPSRTPFTPSVPPGPFGAPPAPPAALPGAASSGNTLGTVASRQTFDTLDRNKDGMINPDEWGNSRRVGPGFKEKGIDISKDMSQADFHANYAKAFPPR